MTNFHFVSLSRLINTSPDFNGKFEQTIWMIWGQHLSVLSELTLNGFPPHVSPASLKRDHIDVLIVHVGPLYISMCMNALIVHVSILCECAVKCVSMDKFIEMCSPLNQISLLL